MHEIGGALSEHIMGGDLHTMVHRHERDLYRGNGKPGITTRVALLEDIVDKISRNLSKIIWLLVSAIVTGLVAITVDIAVKLK